ncbi:MAG: type 4a pilus biogenesis protein PilO [Deltaproteobacteria bacterium]|nr:type 4a pilus biogenesis protein PilO [Deltaproteobacteria bacterium]
MNLNFLEKLTLLRVVLMSLVMVIVPSAILFFAVISPAYERLIESKISRENAQATLLRERELFAKRAVLRHNLDTLRKFEALAKAQLPENKDMPMILANVENLSKEVGIKVLSFIPQKESLKDTYAEIPINVTLEGTFEQIQIFVDELSRFNRIINVSNIQLYDPFGYPVQGKVSLSGKLLITAFRQLTEEEKKIMEAKREEKKGKSKEKRKVSNEEDSGLNIRKF